jgi:murein DD-endopeptidase MepM/ murein hydrolase activator NlpD
LEDDIDSINKNISGLSFRDLASTGDSVVVDENNFLFVNDDIEKNTFQYSINKLVSDRISKVGHESFTGFVVDIVAYLASRFRVVWVLLSVLFEIFVDATNFFKEKLLKQMFWGRGGFLKSTIQSVFIVFFVVIGFSYVYRKPVVIEASDTPLDTVGVVESDLIAANTSLKTLIPKDRARRSVEDYIVKSGDTLSNIAGYFNVSIDSVLWANGMDEDDYIKPGQKLQIPPSDGVLVTVNSGDTLSSLAKKYAANEQSIADFNWLDYPFELTKGQELFIPDGEMPEPPKPVYASTPTYSYTYGSSSYTQTSVGNSDPNVGKFLSWPVQGGAGSISQYYKGYIHRGVDIASSALPNIVAPASGTVIFAGCAPGCYCPALGSTWGGSGYAWSIQIDHGNGYTTWYAHLSNIYVRSGQSVSTGTVIGKMGSTGRSTGPHTHWELRRGVAYGTDVNPVLYLK